MNSLRNLPVKLSCISLIVMLSASLVAAQQARGSLRGLITDELGAAIVGASVTITDASGVQKKTTTNGEGVYTFAGLAPGKYTLQAAAPGFATSDGKEVDITTARQTVDLTLRVTIEEKVTVAETAVSTEATNNANQTVIAGKHSSKGIAKRDCSSYVCANKITLYSALRTTHADSDSVAGN